MLGFAMAKVALGAQSAAQRSRQRQNVVAALHDGLRRATVADAQQGAFERPAERPSPRGTAEGHLPPVIQPETQL
jgi:hypothetical protein